MSASLTARARARAELTNEIKSAARRQLAEVGAAALSSRAIARELGMVSSALYRYFPSRDDLLTALIVDAYDAVGTVAEEAETGSTGPFVERWVAVTAAIRGWAIETPHEYALVYGSPVPGYHAPEETLAPAMRVHTVGLRLVADGLAAGEINPEPVQPLPRRVRTDLRSLQKLAPGMPEDVLSRGLEAWAAMFGSINLELFGHFGDAVSDYAAFFVHQTKLGAMHIASL